MIEKRVLLSPGATAPGQAKGFAVMITFVLTAIVLFASALVAVSGIKQSAPADAPIDLSADKPVYVIPMNPEAQSTRRRSRELQDNDWEDWEDWTWDEDYYGREPPGKPTITWDTDCPKSSLQCKTTSGDWVDVSDLMEFSWLLGSGYEGAFGGCAQGWPNVSPYSVSHAGGVYTKAYKHLVGGMRERIDNYMKSIKLDSFGDMVNDGGYSTTCQDLDYFSEDYYTCGLQFIQMAVIYRGIQCEQLRGTSNQSIKINASTFSMNDDKDDEGYHRVFDDAANIDPDLKKLRNECEWGLGKIPIFDAMKKFSLLKEKEAFIKFMINVSVPVDRGSYGTAGVRLPLLRQFQYLKSNEQLTQDCKIEIVVAIGSPSCDAPVVAVPDARLDGEDFKENVSNYQLGKYGFEYNAPNNIWHRKGVEGCDKGCCDDCFQWHCPLYAEETDTFGNKTQVRRDGSTNLPYECFKYTYNCSKAGETQFNGSSAQVCGVATDANNIRLRCT